MTALSLAVSSLSLNYYHYSGIFLEIIFPGFFLTLLASEAMAGMALELPSFMLGESSEEDARRKENGEAEPKTSRGGKVKAEGKGVAASSGGDGRKSDLFGTGSRVKGSLAEEILVADAELTLQAAQDMREVKGNMEVCCLAPGDAPCILDSLDEGRLYSQEAARKKGQNLGTSAHVKIGVRFLKSISTSTAFVSDPGLKDALQNFWQEKVCKMSEEELKSEIQIFRVSKPKHSSKAAEQQVGGEYAKLCFRFKPATVTCNLAETLQEMLIERLKKLDWTLKWGAAPRSQKEKRLKKALLEAARK